ncbi:MAG: caspase family protein [Planctomycetota bacterium]
MKRRTWTLGVVVAGVLGAGVWLAWPRWESDVPPPPDHVEARDRTFALLVGCTEYPGLKTAANAAYYEQKIRLKGPAEDVHLLARTLHDYLGVPHENMRKLVGWPEQASERPTRANVLAALDHLASQVRPGDRVLFQFAGHGTRQPDREGDEDDGLDEVLLTADAAALIGRSGGLPGAITDDELHARLRALVDAGATVLALFDCCHSGTLSRDPTVRTREVAPEVLGLPTRPDQLPDTTAPEEAGSRGLSGIAAVYAARSWQRAPEMRLPLDSRAPDRRWHGLLTWHVVRALQRHGAGLTVAELQALLVAAYRAQPYGSASPFAEGDLSMRVARDERLATPPLQAVREDGVLRLDAGSLRGIEEGARIALFPPGRLGEDEAKLCTATVTAASALSAWLETSGTALVGNGPFGAKLEGAGIPSTSLSLDIEGLDAAARRQLDAVLALKDGTRFRTVGPEDASWRAWSEDGQVLLARREAGVGPTLSVRAFELPGALETVLRAESLRALAEPRRLPDLPEGLRVELRWFDRYPVSDAEWEAGRPFEQDRDELPGTLLGLRVRNAGPVAVDLGLVSVDAACGVTVLFPREEGVTSRLEPRSPVWTHVGPWPLVDDPLGVEMVLALAIPRPEGDESAYDFTHLTTSSVARARAAPGKESGTAAAWLERWTPAGFAARGGPTSGELAVRAYTWRTTAASWQLAPAWRAAGLAVPADQRQSARAPTDDAPPDPRFVGTHDLLLPAEQDVRAAAYVTWDEDAVQVHVDATDRRGWASMDPATRRVAAARGTLGGDVVLRRTPGADITFTAPEDPGRGEVLIAPRSGPGARWTAEPDGGWQSRSAWVTWPDTAAARRGATWDDASFLMWMALGDLARGGPTAGPR